MPPAAAVAVAGDTPILMIVVARHQLRGRENAANRECSRNRLTTNDPGPGCDGPCRTATHPVSRRAQAVSHCDTPRVTLRPGRVALRHAPCHAATRPCRTATTPCHAATSSCVQCDATTVVGGLLENPRAVHPKKC